LLPWPLVAAAALFFACSLANAQSAVVARSPAATAEQTLLEEVIVTARRRAELLLEVPMAVTAVGGDELEQLGALDLTWLTQTTPNTTVEPARGTNNALAAYIRGVGQQDHIAGFEPGVGLYVDDVYFNRPQVALLDLYEVERIEVLRGPQGTLYGRNTVGGAIRYVTRRFGDEPELRLRGRVGNYGLLDAIVSGSHPAGETLRVGGTFATFRLAGFGENLYLPGVGNYEKDVQAARLALEWAPREDWYLRLAGDWLQDDSHLRRGHRTRVGGYSGAPVLSDVYDTRAGNIRPTADASASGGSLLVEWAAADALTWRAILASREDETWKPVDLDGLPTVDADTGTWDRNEQNTVELQAVFRSSRWSGVAGLFLLDASASTVLDTVLGVVGEIVGRPGLGNQLQGYVDTRSWAVFGDVTFDADDQWAVSLGGRYTADERTSRILRDTMVGGFSPFFGGSAVAVYRSSDFDGSADFDRFTPRASLQWRPVEEHNLYLSYSEGFKGGGFDPRGLTTETPDFDGDGSISEAEVLAYMRFEPETVGSWEVGWKATLLGGRMNSRLAVFAADYRDVQIPGAKAVDTNGDGLAEEYAGITSNAARADTRGLEWEAAALLARDLGAPGAQLHITGSLGYIDAEFREYIDENGNDVADQRKFSNTPEWTASVTGRYGLPVDWFGVAGHFEILSVLSWRDDQFQFERPIPEFDQPAYTLWDLSVIWSDQPGRWQVALQGRNLGDTRYRVSGLDIPVGVEDNYTVYHGNPRQYWLDLAYRF